MYQKSKVCQEELDYALSLNKLLIPVVVEPISWDNIKSSIGRLNFIFADTPDKFMSACKKILEVAFADEKYISLHTSYTVQSYAWEQAERHTEHLLQTTEQMEEAHHFLEEGFKDGKEPRPTVDQQRFINESSKFVHQKHVRSHKRHCVVGIFISVMIALTLALGGIVIYFHFRIHSLNEAHDMLERKNQELMMQCNLTNSTWKP